MSKGKIVAAIVASAVVGLTVGIMVANWKFHDPDVLLAARILLGGFGAMGCGFAAKWLLTPAPET